MARALFIVALLLAAVMVAPFAQARNVVTEDKKAAAKEEKEAESPAPSAVSPVEGPASEPSAAPEPSSSR
uniref:Uncharacterized protein n=1 Tax=Aegilops tauschii TaxID=37682 RepID=N1R5P7_AEGTA